MKKLMDRIDRFCYTHPRFGIPRLMMYIVLGNVVVWMLMRMDTTSRIYQLLCLSGQGVLCGQIWRIVTFLFVPGDMNVLWFILAMYFYYWIGNSLEREWGSGKFTIYYGMGALLTVLYAVLMTLILGQDVIVAPTYLNLSMFFAFATLFPDVQVLLFFIIPIKVKWLAYVDAALFVLAIITTAFPVNLLPIVAILNYLIFCGDWLFAYFRPARIRQNRKTVSFQKEARRVRREQAAKPYHHRCEVCGLTDADFPNLEFRYCSRCKGYHCFCEEHINNHEHFAE